MPRSPRQLPLLAEGDAEAVVVRYIAGFEADGRAVLGDRRVPLPLEFQGIAEADMDPIDVGFSRMAVWSSAMASSSFPLFAQGQRG